MLRDLVPTVKQSGDKQVAAIRVTQHHARPLVRRYQTHRIATLLIRHGRRLPRLNTRWRLRHLCGRTALRNIRIVRRAASSRALLSTWSTSTDAVVDVVDRAVETIH